ncbi:unnamed protein product [Cuscuta campestris]|uniref:Uncharacterized protein n=1 Tax=Cuscuta campestris TaxID=132261 RepID=A0A484KQ18_9ASTE|nr:unnamed protein product [Cuscuta campestris]VFQ88397.1 unnamed protein product [Cuscuta campestris]
MERTLKNTNMKPLNHSSYLRLQVLCQHFWDVEEKQCLLHNLCIADLKAFLLDLLSQDSMANQSKIDDLTIDGNTTTKKSHDEDRQNKDDEAESDGLQDVDSDEH